MTKTLKILEGGHRYYFHCINTKSADGSIGLYPGGQLMRRYTLLHYISQLLAQKQIARLWLSPHAPTVKQWIDRDNSLLVREKLTTQTSTS